MHARTKKIAPWTAAVAAFLLMALAGSTALRGEPAEAQAEAEREGPAVLAVKFHADWCGYCKQMGGVFEEMQAKFDQQPALFVTLDQTQSPDRRQARYMAHALGLEDVWAEHGGKTGFILLIDAGSREVIERLGHEQDLKQMGEALARAVEKAST